MRRKVLTRRVLKNTFMTTTNCVRDLKWDRLLMGSVVPWLDPTSAATVVIDLMRPLKVTDQNSRKSRGGPLDAPEKISPSRGAHSSHTISSSR